MSDYMARFNRDAGDLAMMAERFPDLAPQIAEMMQKAVEPLEKLRAWCAGEISDEEYTAYRTAYEAEDRAKREAKYGPGPVYEVECGNCGESYEWDRRDEDDLPPPVYFECEDMGADSCTEQDEEEN
jgi:hypothetical protein